MLKILLVDDNKVMCNALTQMMAIQNINVTAMLDGTRVMDEINKAKYDIIVMDIEMPNLNGLETITAVRNSDKKIPILAISGGGINAPEENLTKAQKEGATGTLAKPFDSITLVNKIREMLQRLILI